MRLAGRTIRRSRVRGVILSVLLACTSIYATSGLVHHRTSLGRLLCPVCQVMAHGSTVVPRLVPAFTAPVLYRLSGRVLPHPLMLPPSPLSFKTQSRAPPTLIEA